MADLAAGQEETDERELVYRHRYREAREAGFSIVEAALFSESDADVGELRRLVALGCPAGLIRKIVL